MPAHRVLSGSVTSTDDEINGSIDFKINYLDSNDDPADILSYDFQKGGSFVDHTCITDVGGGDIPHPYVNSSNYEVDPHQGNGKNFNAYVSYHVDVAD